MTMFRAQRHVLMAAAGDGNSGGGGNGDGDGGDPPEIPEHLQKFVAQEIQKGVNGALSSWGKRFETKTGETVKSALAEALKDFKPKADDGGSGDGDGQARQNGGSGGGDQQVTLELKKLRGELESVTKAREKERAEAQAKEETRMRAEERSALNTALLKAGVPDARAAGASALLFHDKKLVARNDAGEICIKVTKTYGSEKVDELVPLDAGVTEWLKTPEGKEYAPAVAASGSGNRGGRAPERGAGGKPTVTSAYAALGQFLLNPGSGNGQ